MADSSNKKSSVAGLKVLITGASKGIGKSLAIDLAQHGAEVFGIARGEDSLNALAREVASSGGIIHTAECDVSDAESINSTIEIVAARWGGLDTLINNAGGAIGYKDFFSLSDEEWQATFNLNVMSIVRLCKACLPLLESSSQASVVNVLSTVARQPGWMYPHYSACKAAGLNFSKHLSNRFAELGIRVNSVSPGPIHSHAWNTGVQAEADRSGSSIEVTRERIERLEAAKVPLKRVGEGSDIAGLVRWLVSEEASWVTGSDFTIDGGKNRGI